MTLAPIALKTISAVAQRRGGSPALGDMPAAATLPGSKSLPAPPRPAEQTPPDAGLQRACVREPRLQPGCAPARSVASPAANCLPAQRNQPATPPACVQAPRPSCSPAPLATGFVALDSLSAPASAPRGWAVVGDRACHWASAAGCP